MLNYSLVLNDRYGSRPLNAPPTDLFDRVLRRLMAEPLWAAVGPDQVRCIYWGMMAVR